MKIPALSKKSKKLQSYPGQGILRVSIAQQKPQAISRMGAIRTKAPIRKGLATVHAKACLIISHPSNV